MKTSSRDPLDIDSFQSFLIEMVRERSLETLQRLIANRLVESPHVGLVHLWMVRAGDICESCPMRAKCPDQTSCLHLVASAFQPATENGDDWAAMDGDLKRFPMGMEKLGSVGTSGEPLTWMPIEKDADGIVCPDWAWHEKIRGFTARPLVYCGRVIGVLGVFTRTGNGKGDELHGLDAVVDYAAVALANAQDFEKLNQIIREKARVEGELQLTDLVQISRQKKLSQMAAERERMESELELATRVQKGFLPERPPNHSDFVFAAKMVPAKFVGGDFYDFIPLERNRLGIVLGDVSGKGVSAALYMARLMSDFRFASQSESDPAKVMKQINNVLYERSQQGMFTTAIFLLIDLEYKRLRTSNAGHHSILIRDTAGRVLEKGAAGGPPLGILPNSDYGKEEILLESGSRVLLFTDGAIEPKNEKGEQFGFERLVNLFSKEQSSPEGLISRLHKTLDQFTQHTDPQDDVTYLAIQVH